MEAEKEEEDPAPASGDQDVPDWTSWLRSRLERVSSSERKAAGSVQDAPGETAAEGDGQRRDDSGPGREPATSAPVAVPAPPPAPAPPSPPAPAVPARPTPTPAPAVPPPAPVPPTAPAPAPAPSPSGSPASGPASTVEIEALRAAVAALVAGVGALADTFSGFRSAVTERLDEYSQTVLRATSDIATENKEYRSARARATDELRRTVTEIGERLRGLTGGMADLATIRRELEEHREAHVGSTDDLGRTVTEIGERVEHLARGMDELAAIRSDDERWAEVMGRLLDEVDAERHAGSGEEPATEGVVERLEGLEQSLQRVASDVGEVVAGQHRGATEVAEMTSQQQSLAAEVAEMTSQQQSLAAEVAEMVAHQQRLATDLAAVATAQQGVATDLATVAAGQRSSADGHGAPVRLDEEQVRLLAEAVLEAAADMRPPPAASSPPTVLAAPAAKPPSPPERPPDRAAGRRRAPLRAERKPPSPRSRR